MARQIPSPFGPWNGSGVSWSDLFNGGAWELRKGDDFDLAAGTVAAHIRAEYLRLYGGLNIKEDGDVLRIERVVGVNEVGQSATPAPTGRPRSFSGRTVLPTPLPEPQSE